MVSMHPRYATAVYAKAQAPIYPAHALLGLVAHLRIKQLKKNKDNQLIEMALLQQYAHLA